MDMARRRRVSQISEREEDIFDITGTGATKGALHEER